MDERFSRVRLFLGEAEFARLSLARVMICGLGAVGSYAAEALSRMGVGSIALVDFDEVRPSNINRQLFALDSTVGKLKVEVAAERIRDINPRCIVSPIAEFIDAKSVKRIPEIAPHLVIDAIDSLASKVELLVFCKQNNIPVISSMGAAMRRDPLQVRIGTIADAGKCPLARHVRKRLRRRQTCLDIECVYSQEPLPNPLPIAPADSISSKDHLLNRGRERNVLGSLPTITGLFGLVLAQLALDRIQKMTFLD